MATGGKRQILMVIGRLRGMETLSILNNVVLYQGDLAEGVNSLVNSADLVAKGSATRC